MKDLDAIREDVEIEMAKELASCRGDVYAEKEALWLALRDERVTKRCTVSDIRQAEPCVCGHTRRQHPEGNRCGVCIECRCNEFSAVTPENELRKSQSETIKLSTRWNR